MTVQTKQNSSVHEHAGPGRQLAMLVDIFSGRGRQKDLGTVPVDRVSQIDLHSLRGRLQTDGIKNVVQQVRHFLPGAGGEHVRLHKVCNRLTTKVINGEQRFEKYLREQMANKNY